MFFTPVDGQWNSWQPWSVCNVTCGGGSSMRTRLCQKPEFGGQECDGEKAETKTCNEHHCPSRLTTHFPHSAIDTYANAKKDRLNVDCHRLNSKQFNFSWMKFFWIWMMKLLLLSYKEIPCKFVWEDIPFSII